MMMMIDMSHRHTDEDDDDDEDYDYNDDREFDVRQINGLWILCLSVILKNYDDDYYIKDSNDKDNDHDVW